MTLSELNTCDRNRFATTLEGVFEDSRWVAERAWARRPFATLTELHAAMVSEVTLAGHEEQLALLRAHPELGARARMSAQSEDEQSRAGLARIGVAESSRLEALNAEYRRKFQFPFLFAVKGSTSYAILAALEARLPRRADEEFEEALTQACRIAWFRLQETVE